MGYAEEMGIAPFMPMINFIERLETIIKQDIVMVEVDNLINAEGLLEAFKDTFLIHVILGPVPITCKVLKPKEDEVPFGLPK